MIVSPLEPQPSQAFLVSLSNSTMRFSALLSFVAGLAVCTSGYAIDREALIVHETFNDTQLEDTIFIEKRSSGPCPKVRQDVDPKLWQVVRRKDTRAWVPRGKEDMSGLEAEVKKIGRHHDVLMSTATSKCYTLDLQFKGDKWKDYKDADGAPIVSVRDEYKEIENGAEITTYMGVLPRGVGVSEVEKDCSLLFFVCSPLHTDSCLLWKQ